MNIKKETHHVAKSFDPNIKRNTIKELWAFLDESVQPKRRIIESFWPFSKFRPKPKISFKNAIRKP